MSNNMFDVNILVNGNRCKLYTHQGKNYVQANQGSEYVIEIKNNYYKRILSVISVDGLNALSGKTASENDSGYIIDSYSSEKIKGFRFSDNEWAMFKFGYKFNGRTYAQSKNDGSEINCGIFGIRLFYEQEPLVIYNTPVVTWNNPLPTPINPSCPPSYPSWPIITYDGIGGHSNGGASYTSNVNFMVSAANSSDGLCGNTLRSSDGVKSRSSGITSRRLCASPEPKGFDMGTEWGRKEQSKIHTVNFEKGYLAHSLDIYYASRESLIEMGVPLTSNLKINLPQSFPEKYAKPPRGWNG